MVTSPKLPVLVLAYNRPGLVRELLKTLPPENVSSLYISIDGPRSKHDEFRAQEIIEIADEFSQKIPVVIRHSSSNLGCRLGVIAGLDWFFSHAAEGGLVLEDDCFPKPGFFDFLTQNLILVNTNKVAMITAHNPLTEVRERYYKSRFAFIYGWYMLGSTWEHIRKGLFEVATPSRFTQTRNPRSWSEATYWWATYARARIGIHDTWDSLFYRVFCKEGFECLVPKVNLIENKGFGEGATHTLDPEGSILLDRHLAAAVDQNSAKELDDLIARHHFKIRMYHCFTPYVRVLRDAIKIKKLPDFDGELQANQATIIELGKH